MPSPSLEHAWGIWEAFLADAEQRIQESVSSGLAPAPTTHDAALRSALAVLSSDELDAFLSHESFVERHRDPEQEPVIRPFMRFAFLLCFLPASAAPVLARRYDDPCGAKSNLPPRASLVLFLTLRWKTFLLANLRREGAVHALQAYRFQIKGFVERAHCPDPLVANDPPALTRELEALARKLPMPPKQPS